MGQPSCFLSANLYACSTIPRILLLLIYFVCFDCTYKVYYISAWCLQVSKEGFSSSGTEVTDRWMWVIMWVLRSEPRFSVSQKVHLTTEPSLQLQTWTTESRSPSQPHFGQTYHTIFLLKNYFFCWLWWLTPAITAVGKLRQFKASFSYMKPWLKHYPDLISTGKKKCLFFNLCYILLFSPSINFIIYIY